MSVKVIERLIRDSKLSFVRVGIAGSIRYRKWLAYVPDFLQERISEISSKISTNDGDVSDEEIEYYKDFLEQQAVLIELNTYFSDEWYEADIERIKAYIASHPLSKIKKQRLTVKEYNALILTIQEMIGDYSEKEIQEISDENKILNRSNHSVDKDSYDELPMDETFIYDFTDNLDFDLSMQASSDALREAYRRNRKARDDSWESASKHFVI